MARAPARRIAIIQGHPDPDARRFGRALAGAYGGGAAETGHEVRTIDVATLEFPLLRTKLDFDTGTPPGVIREARATIDRAEHLVIFYPLWLGMMPAVLKAFLEQVLRPTLDTDDAEGAKAAGGGPFRRSLAGKSAHIVVTMGMPALVYRWYFGAHSLKSLERNVLRFCGVGSIKESLIGGVENADGAGRARWLAKMRAFGRAGN